MHKILKENSDGIGMQTDGSRRAVREREREGERESVFPLGNFLGVKMDRARLRPAACHSVTAVNREREGGREREERWREGERSEGKQSCVTLPI